MKDIFGLDNTIGGAWSLDGAVLSLGADLDGLVVTSLNVQYTRRSQKFSPLNQAKKYLVTGEADGQAQLGIIIGPSASVVKFLQDYSNPCNVVGESSSVIKVFPVGDNFNTKCPGTNFENVVFTMTGCLINQISISVAQAGGALTVLSAGVTMQFIALNAETQGQTNTSQGSTAQQPASVAA